MHYIYFLTGTGNIPGPIEDLHASSITMTSVGLEWIPYQADANNTDMKDIDFLIQYGKVDNMTMYETVVRLPNVCSHYSRLVRMNNLIFKPKKKLNLTGSQYNE